MHKYVKEFWYLTKHRMDDIKEMLRRYVGSTAVISPSFLYIFIILVMLELLLQKLLTTTARKVSHVDLHLQVFIKGANT